MSTEPNQVKAQLEAAARAKLRAGRWRLMLIGMAVIGVALMVSAGLDYTLELSSGARWLGVGLMGGVVMWMVWGWARSSAERKAGLKAPAMEAESRHPEIGCELSTAAEYLSGDRKARAEYEPELVRALEGRAVIHLARTSFDYGRLWRRPAVGVGLVMALIGILLVSVSGSLTAVQRVVAPWSSAAYTRMEMKSGDLEVPVGRDVELVGRAEGRRPKSVWLERSVDGGVTWESAPMTLTPQGDYSTKVSSVKHSFSYRMSAGGVVSHGRRVNVYVPPEVSQWSLEMTPPAYTRRGMTKQAQPDLNVLRATQVRFEVRPNVPLSKARLRFKDQGVVEMTADAGGGWVGTMAFVKPSEYWVELYDASGRLGVNSTPYRVQVLADAVPRVEILEPGEDMRAEATNRIPVKVTASDDYGVSDLKLVFHRLGDPEQFISGLASGTTNAEMAVELPLALMGLKEYEIVAYHAEARDNNTLDGPGLGRSQVYFVEITNEEGCLCKKPGKPAQKVNLLVVQKQIIADTVAEAGKPSGEKLKELAQRQKDAADFGRIYLESMGQVGTSAAAMREMELALADMTEAHARLEAGDALKAVGPEEKALGRLYGLLKRVPELKELPATPKEAAQAQPEPGAKPPESPLLKVVLEAIKKKPKEQPDTKELEQALNEARELEQQASSLLGVQNTGGAAGKSGEVKLDRSGKTDLAKSNPKAGEGQSEAQKPSPGKGESKSKGQGAGQGQGEGQAQKPGAKGSGEGKPGEDKPGDEAGSAEQVAQKQEEISKEAAALAEKLSQLAGKGSRLGHGASKKMSEASKQMAEAARASRRGDAQGAGTKGFEGDASMNTAIAMLERALANRPERGNVAQEEAPREFEPVISEYLKRLSYAE